MPAFFEKFYSVEMSEASRIQYQFGMRTKQRLIEILQQREFELGVFWSHRSKTIL